MDSEQIKIAQYLSEIEKLQASNLDLVAGREFFEIWEQACNPRPFSVTGPGIALGDYRINIGAKGRYIACLVWNHEKNRPVFMAENSKTGYCFPLIIEDEKISFDGPEKISQVQIEDGQGEEIEVVYDVIDNIMTKKPGADILKLKRKEFTENLESLYDIYDKKLLRRMARLSASRIRTLVEQAASDMALDELSAQFVLPLGGSYAYDVTGDTASSCGLDDNKDDMIFGKTRWELEREIELLLAMSVYNYEMQKNFVLHLRDCEVIRHRNDRRLFVRIPNVKDIPLYEGSKLGIFKRGEKAGLGFFTVSMFDYDTIYGELAFEDDQDLRQLDYLYLLPRREPRKFMMEKAQELFNLVKDRHEEIKGAICFILGLEQGKFSHDFDVKPGPEMDFSQKQAWKASVNPENRVVAVQGPPGTGKTWVLVQVVKFLCKQGMRILVTAPSNTAVDNICRRILDLPLLRLGKPDKIDPKIQNTCWIGNDENVDSYIKKRKACASGTVYAATHMRSLLDGIISKEIRQNGLFDIIIFDEAGMSRMDEFLFCSQLGQKVVVFGDQRQLPPFPLSNEVLNKLKKKHRYTSSSTRDIINFGALEWLAQNRKFPVIMLQRSYRCQNPRLLRFSSTLFYNARVKTSENAEYFRLPYHERKEKYPSSTLQFYNTGSLPKAIRREKIIIEGSGPGLENMCEAKICRHVLMKSLDVYDPDRIMIISPYKRQVKLIKAVLKYEEIRKYLPDSIFREDWNFFLKSKIATVDSFQGGESDLVIISYVRSNEGRGIGFVDSPNRINVAHTRCRRGIIIIGDLECLKKQAKTDIFKKMERAFARDGEIIDMNSILPFLKNGA